MARRKTRPGSSPAAVAAEAERRARQAAALRENLRKRKAQKRGRDEAAWNLEPGEAEERVGQRLEGRPRVK